MKSVWAAVAVVVICVAAAAGLAVSCGERVEGRSFNGQEQGG